MDTADQKTRAEHIGFLVSRLIKNREYFLRMGFGFLRSQININKYGMQEQRNQDELLDPEEERRYQEEYEREHMSELAEPNGEQGEGSYSEEQPKVPSYNSDDEMMELNLRLKQGKSGAEGIETRVREDTRTSFGAHAVMAVDGMC